MHYHCENSKSRQVEKQLRTIYTIIVRISESRQVEKNL